MTEVIRIQEDGPMIEPGDGASIEVPSGQDTRLQDVVWNAPGPEGPAVRFRFLAPSIAREGGTVDFDAAAADMLHLCQTYALPRIEGGGGARGQIIISLSDRAVPFGDSDPDATQFFEAYSVENETCIWEVF